MIYAIPTPMQTEPMQHYLLSAYEAELLAVFRGLEPSGQALVANVIAQQAGRRHIPIEPVELSLVRNLA